MEDNFLKITNAVYKILDFLPDSDPLKNRAKEKVLAILENRTLTSNAPGWVSLKSLLSEEHQKQSRQLLQDMEILKQYLNIGKNQGWIDGINFLIITKEYDSIAAGITKDFPVAKYEFIGKAAAGIVDKNQIKNEPKAKKERTIGQYSPRQEKILEILDRTEKAQVADFIKELSDVTKRTIRRDLDDLLKRKDIVRIGEFNRSFYRRG